MKIVQLIPELNEGGVERGVVELSRELVSLGFESVVISNGGKLVEQLKHDGALHVKVNICSKNIFTAPFRIFKLYQTLKQKSIDPSYETLLFFVPDHAELLGENGKFGHTILELDVAKIPFLYYGIHTNLTAKIRQFNDISTHFEVSRFVANALNVEVIDPNDDNQTVFINGNDLNGKKGLMRYTKKEILEQL